MTFSKLLKASTAVPVVALLVLSACGGGGGTAIMPPGTGTGMPPGTGTGMPPGTGTGMPPGTGTGMPGEVSPPTVPEFAEIRKAANSIPQIGRRSVTQSSNTDGNNVTTDTAEAIFDRNYMALKVRRADGSEFTLDSTENAVSTADGTSVRNDQISRISDLRKQLIDHSGSAQIFGELPASKFPLRAIRAAGNYGTNSILVERWEAGGRREPLVPKDYIDWLKNLHVNQVGLSIALRYDDSMDSTLERVYSLKDQINTFSDDAIRQFIREFRAHGIDVYLTLALQSEAQTSHELVDQPAYRWQLGDPGHPDTGVPSEDPSVFGRILPENWPWRPGHPEHTRFVAEFWKSYTDNAVHFARLAEEEGAIMYSLGTETDRLFRTRSGGGWSNHFGQELTAMVSAVREVYNGFLTYDMHSSAVPARGGFTPGSDHLWADLDLDIVGVSAYFELANTPPSTVLSVAEFEKRYQQIFENYLLPLAERNPGRPIVFLEYGAVDTVEAPASPGATDFSPFEFQDRNGNGFDDGREQQANMYQALVNTMAKFPGLVNGVLWTENWITSATLWAEYWGRRRGFAIRDKLSEKVVQAAHESWGEWLTGGHWMLIDEEMDVVESGAFVDGPELIGTPILPAVGRATYEGLSAGGYAIKYGTDYSSVQQGSHAIGQYKGELQLTADFAARQINGRVHSIYVSGILTRQGGASTPIVNNSIPYELNLGATGFGGQGFTGSTRVTSTDAQIIVSRSSGSWGGKFSTKPDSEGNPRLVAGTHGETLVTGGGTEAEFIGAFFGVTGR